MIKPLDVYDLDNYNKRIWKWQARGEVIVPDLTAGNIEKILNKLNEVIDHINSTEETP